MKRDDARASATRHALLAGGGTGGHIFPALALAAELVRRGWMVSFAGSPQGMEARLVPARGIAFHALPARPILGKGLGTKIAAALLLLRSTWSARGLVRRLPANVVVGTGGYASAPAVLGARLARRPALLFEPNARAGAANRFLSRFASAAALGFPEAAKDLHCGAVVTGVPVRPEFFAVHEALPGAPAPALLVLGGSQGAQALNRVLPAAISRLAARFPGLRVLHQAGERNLEETRAAYAAAGAAAHAEVVPFIDDVAGAMAASDLVVSRAGAMTLAEIRAAGRPVLLLPLGVAAGHQVDNARALANEGAARFLVPEEATAERLSTALGELLADPDALRAMAAAARAGARPGAVEALADRVEALVKEAA